MKRSIIRGDKMEFRSNKFGWKKNKKIGKLYKFYDVYLMELIEVM